MNLNMQSVSRTAEAIEWPSVPRKNPPKRRFGLRDWACVLFVLTGLVFITTTDASPTKRPGKDIQPPTVSIASPLAGSI